MELGPAAHDLGRAQSLVGHATGVHAAGAVSYTHLDVYKRQHWHPAPIAAVVNVRMAANDAMKIEFHGQTAHAGLEPWKGRSALHAMELAAHGLNLMREHLEPTARLHYVFESAGQAPNVVPDYARLWLVVRDIDRRHVVATTNWVKQIADGAALATQTTATVDVYIGKHDLLPLSLIHI